LPGSQNPAKHLPAAGELEFWGLMSRWAICDPECRWSSTSQLISRAQNIGLAKKDPLTRHLKQVFARHTASRLAVTFSEVITTRGSAW
jgi:hypothetical protein